MSGQPETLLELLKAVSFKLIAGEKVFTELDSAIGDGDCGVSLKKGFQNVLDRLPAMVGQSMGGILTQVGMTLMSSVGGVSGAIYATGFMRAGKAVGDREAIDLQIVAQVLRAALEGMKERGEGTRIGDKTLVDALEPAVDSFARAAGEGRPAKEVLKLATEAARKGSDSTIPLVARKGRASYLGQRSVGHRDAGSVVICHIFEAACEFCEGKT